MSEVTPQSCWKRLEGVTQCFCLNCEVLLGPVWTQPNLMNEQLKGQPQLRLQYVCWLNRHCTSWFVLVHQNQMSNSFYKKHKFNWNCCDSLSFMHLFTIDFCRLVILLCFLSQHTLQLVAWDSATIICDGCIVQGWNVLCRAGIVCGGQSVV